jgi:hypothetical protein
MYLLHVNPISSGKWDEKSAMQTDSGFSSGRESRQQSSHGEEHVGAR